ncbi:MAG: aromatic amino acid lyase [Planctomycetes bacterium]|nr:aromatic amino acid lyase [Planctomycetota bacterium]
MIALDGHTLDISVLWAISKGQQKVELSPNAIKRMEKSRDLVDKLAGQERAIYGINTGFGPLSGARVSDDDLKQHQINLLHHLSVGQGELFSLEETRSIMAARANALARGFSGISPKVVQLLLDCINHNILPEIPMEGSIGASGDLVPLAHMARMLIGLGSVRTSDGRKTAVEAFKEAGLEPIELKCKEGIALVNGTSAMTGIAGLDTYAAGKILSWMEFLCSGLFQVMSGEPEVLCEQAHHARGHRGQNMVAGRIADFLKSNPEYKKEINDHLWGSHSKPVEWGIEIQDPYSLRCVPQILGAFQDSYWHVEMVLNRELNASTDNPLVFAETESVIHNGNFYGQHTAMVSDYLRMGLIKMAVLSERQLDRLVNWRYSQGLPPMLSGAREGLNSGMMGCQLLATSIVADARLLGMPGSIQSISSNANNQDVVSMGMSSAKLTRAVIPKCWTLLAIEALALCQAAEFRKDEQIFKSTFGGLYERVREVSPTLVEDRPLYEDIEAVVKLLKSEQVQNECFPERPQGPLEIK